jgi:hypothetical protein
VAQFIDDDGVLQANETMDKSADVLLGELVRVSEALAVLRGSGGES